MPASGARAVWRIAAVFIVLLGLHQLFSFHGSFSSQSPNSLADSARKSNKKPLSPNCDSKQLKGMEDVFVMLKTGANEVLDKVPTHFSTTLKCVPNYAIYSDLEEDVEGYHVYDAFTDMDPRIVANNKDFEYYQKLQSKGRGAFSSDELMSWANAQNTPGGRDSPGWKLDKWKFLPIAEKAYNAMPDAKWFILMEADTYISWRGMLEWLSHFDATKPNYIGQQMMIADVIFAYGGAGFMISNPAMKMVLDHHRQNIHEYNEYTDGHWAGDCVLGKALRDVGVDLLWSWPNLMGDSPSLMDWNSEFGGADKRLWCHYAASYHHLLPQDVGWLYAFEEKWNKENSTLRHKDVFKNYILPHIKPERADWDNDSQNKVKEETTFDDCRRQCEMQLDCVQFALKNYTCYIDTIVKLGHEKPAGPMERFASGWMIDRVHDKINALDKSCKDANWILP